MKTNSILIGINKSLILIGCLCSLIWSFMTAITFGISPKWCGLIDKITFGLVSREVGQMANGFFYDRHNNDMPTVIYLFLFGVIFLLVFFLIRKIERGRGEKFSLGIIIFFSIYFRLLVLPGIPIHENDFYRYIWDAKASIQKVNPFKYAPADLFMFERGLTEDYKYGKDVLKARPFSDQDGRKLNILIKNRNRAPVFYSRIGHWEVPTIYPPIAQILFILPVLINEHSIILMKMVFVFFDIGVLFLCVAFLRHFGKNPCLSFIYGWSPLVIISVANGGHYDSIPVFFTMLGLYLWIKNRPLKGTCVLALATLSKFFSIVLLPILMRPFKKKYLIVFASVVAVFYLPYIFWDNTGIGGLFQGLSTYNEQWAYNSSIFKVVYLLMDAISPSLTETLVPAKAAVGLMYLGFLTFLVIRKSESSLHLVYKCFIATAVLFIINPVADSWYFCWVMPFLCLFPYRSWLLLSGLIMLGYLNFHSDIGIVDIKIWSIPLISWLTYIPFFIYLAVEYIRSPEYIQHK